MMWIILLWVLIGALCGITFFNTERTDWYNRYKQDLPENLKQGAFIISLICGIVGPIAILALIIILYSYGKLTFFYKGK